MIKFGKKIDGIEDRLPALGELLSRRQDIQTVYLFGSRGSGTADDLSDVDISILMNCSRLTFDAESSLMDEITSALGTDEISLVILNNAPLTIAYGAIKGARVLYSRDEGARLDFEGITARKYFDFRYYLDSYDREFIRQVLDRTKDDR